MVTKHASTGKQSSGCRSAQSFANRHISDNQPCPESRVSRSAWEPLRGFRVCGPGSGVQVRGSRVGPWSGVWVRGGGPVSLWGPWSGLRSGISGRQSLSAVRPQCGSRVRPGWRLHVPMVGGSGSCHVRVEGPGSPLCGCGCVGVRRGPRFQGSEFEGSAEWESGVWGSGLRADLLRSGVWGPWGRGRSIVQNLSRVPSARF